VCPSSRLKGSLGLWVPVYHPDFTIIWQPQLWRSVSVCSSLHLLTRAHCAKCSPFLKGEKSLHLLNHLIARFAYLCQVISEKFDLRSFLNIKLFSELCVAIALNNRSAVTHNKFNLLKFPLQSSCSEHTNHTFVLLICFCWLLPT